MFFLKRGYYKGGHNGGPKGGSHTKGGHSKLLKGGTQLTHFEPKGVPFFFLVKKITKRPPYDPPMTPKGVPLFFSSADDRVWT